jgi:hypothetical protein
MPKKDSRDLLGYTTNLRCSTRIGLDKKDKTLVELR